VRVKASPLARAAVGLALAVAALLLLVQALMHVAVSEVTDDYARRFMRGTVDLLVHELAPLDESARASRVRELDERFAYPVALVPEATLPPAVRAALARGELAVSGLNRRVHAALPGVPAQVLELGPLDPDWNPEHRLRLPRELWLQGAVALLLAGVVGCLSWLLLRPAWRDLRALRRAADALAGGHFDTPLPALSSRLFSPVGEAGRAALTRLGAALAAQRELTGAVSHELRTPLARLRFAIDALAVEEDPARREDAAQACERDIDELDALIDASLVFARLDLGAWQARPEPGDLAALLAHEARTLAPLLEGRALDTTLALPGPVDFDARLLPYAVRNGLRNAARYARGRVGLSAWREGGDVLVAVDDDGEGIPPAQREAVFQPFRRLDRSRDRASGGFGLGLAIVARVMQQHGGRASAEDSPLGGARLLLRWPAGGAG
jgi:two-component system sensor histidine kinase RstB